MRWRTGEAIAEQSVSKPREELRNAPYSRPTSNFTHRRRTPRCLTPHRPTMGAGAGRCPPSAGTRLLPPTPYHRAGGLTELWLWHRARAHRASNLTQGARTSASEDLGGTGREPRTSDADFLHHGLELSRDHTGPDRSIAGAEARAEETMVNTTDQPAADASSVEVSVQGSPRHRSLFGWR